LKGEWDLLGGILAVTLPDQVDPLPLQKPYTLVDSRNPFYLRFFLSDGWYESEHLARANLRWRWTMGDANLVIQNPQDRPLNVRFRLQARSLSPRDLQVWTQGRPRRFTHVGTELSWLEIPSIVVPPGELTVELRSPTPPERASEADTRLLGFAAYGIELIVR